MVNLEGKNLFCDVGYGGPIPHGSIEWETDKTQAVGNQSFYFEGNSSGWFTLVKKGVEDEPLLQASQLKCYLSDFYGANLLRSTGDSAYSTLHVSLLTPDGYMDLTGNKFVIKRGSGYEERIVGEDELVNILRDYFKIERLTQDSI